MNFLKLTKYFRKNDKEHRPKYVTIHPFHIPHHVKSTRDTAVGITRKSHAKSKKQRKMASKSRKINWGKK